MKIKNTDYTLHQFLKIMDGGMDLSIRHPWNDEQKAVVDLHLLYLSGQPNPGSPTADTRMWVANDFAKTIDDLSLVPALLSYVPDPHKSFGNSLLKRIRQRKYKLSEYAIRVLGYILVNTKDQSLAKELIDLIGKNPDNFWLVHSILVRLNESQIHLDYGHEHILDRAMEGSELIRVPALKVLEQYTTDQEEIESGIGTIVSLYAYAEDMSQTLDYLQSKGTGKIIPKLERLLAHEEEMIRKIKETIQLLDLKH